ncbi:Uncharacterized conserved protein VgrG [Commensalibacter papalotli (ex Botero et al. 2024)]|uniref:Implicated in type VI secretion and phage assembly (VgrG) (PDB:6SJL) (PUBMED:16980477) n=2 Tax=Commensalibacter papalotli (ex Botero et al. 2024) TaxID=2972766 RepID=A0ABM9HRE9_9PROT|nr:Uncharacterized conserved protein VgrG [Commensalibacter papalotli (ex Botero et al. 2024)]CAI3948821.1 Uncharacterized conserved protein VgrG [Commensalibacter papalotli (ex Botero et al. 2024)]
MPTWQDKHKKHSARQMKNTANNLQPWQNQKNQFNLLTVPIRVHTGLGDGVDRYASLSPTLVRQIKELQDHKWAFEWNAPGKGSITYFDKDNKQNKILINIQYNPQNDPDPSYAIQKEKYVTSILAHEVGHAQHEIQYDTSSMEACIASAMKGPGSEAEAVYNSVIVRKEILKNSNNIVDIFNNGNDSLEEMNNFQKIMEQNNRSDAINQIGDLYSMHQVSSKPFPTYTKYYGDYCANIVKKH